MWIPQRYADYVYRAELILENSDTGQELIINSEDNQQPTNVVADTVEENAETLQPADEVEFELQIDDEGKPEKEPEEKQPDYEMARKAFKEREEKRKKREKEEAELKALNERLAKLESENKKLAAGPKPTLADCDFDEALYQEKLTKYITAQNSVNATQQQSSDNEKSDNKEIPAEILITADKQESEVKSKYKGYEADKTDLAMKFVNDGFNPDQLMSELQVVCHADGTDFAKAVIALSKVPGAYDGLKQSSKGGPVAVAKHIRTVAGKVKLAEAKKIDTQPEPNINSSGSVDNSTSQLAKAYKDWKEETNQHKQLQKWNTYQALKKKVKQNG